jgi:hypothetical protein
MPDRWYYIRDKRRAGPVPLATLRRMVESGALTSGDMVFQEGTQKWVPAGAAIAVLAPAAAPPTRRQRQRAPDGPPRRGRLL